MADAAGFPFSIVDLRQHYVPELVTVFYNFMSRFFPIPDEMDPCDLWIEQMTPDPSQMVPMFGLAVFDPKAAPDAPLPPSVEPVASGRLVGGVMFEYYTLSNAGLLSYVCVEDAYQGRGIARKLVAMAFRCLQQESCRPHHLSSAPAPPSSASSLQDQALRLITRMDPALIPSAVWTSALATVSKEDLALAALGTAPAPFFAFFAETNAVGVEDGVMDVQTRHQVLHNLGFRLLDFNFVQPPLSEDQAPCYDLLLLAFTNEAIPVVETPASAGPASKVVAVPAMPRWQLQLFMFDYALSTHLNCSFVGEAYWQYMMASVPPTLPLQSLPWTRRSRAPPSP